MDGSPFCDCSWLASAYSVGMSNDAIKTLTAHGYTIAPADVYVSSDAVTLCTLVSVCDACGFSVAELA
jgi:hypothetical protein